MKETYLTLGRSAKDEYIVKRSRFIGYARPVKTQDEATAFIEEIRTRHWDATHNVYAYILRENQIKRYSDDGEPQGTAGVPVLDVLQKENLTDCAVVVTRYFGGTMLGAGGLVRAYSHSAKIAVIAAGIIKMELCSLLELECDYSFYGRLSSLLADFNAVVEDTIFEDNVKTSFLLPKKSFDSFQAKLTDQSSGQIFAKVIDERFEDIKS